GCVLVPKHVGPKPAIEGLLIGFEHILAQAKASMKKSLVILVRGIEMVNQVQQGPPVKLAAFDRGALLDLIHHLYAAHKDNQAFLHARFGLGEDVLEPYKKTFDRWLWPDVFQNQDTSVSQAKRAIADYRKAVGDPAGLAELMVFYCEQAAGFCRDIGYQEEGYFDALVRMFEQAIRSTNPLPANGRDGLIARLDRVREISHAFGYGVGDDMDFLLAKYIRSSG